MKQDVEFWAAGPRPLALYSCTWHCAEPPDVEPSKAGNGPATANSGMRLGPGRMHTASARGRSRAPGAPASPEWPSRPAPHRGGCGTPVYAAKGTALRKQSPCRPQRDGGSPRGGAAALTPTRRLQQKAFCYLQHPRAPAPTSSSGASCTAR